MPEDYVRVLRLIEYSGPRTYVEAQLLNSMKPGTHRPGDVQISITQLGEFPEIIERPAYDYLLESTQTLRRHLALFCSKTDDIANAIFEQADEAIAKATNKEPIVFRKTFTFVLGIGAAIAVLGIAILIFEFMLDKLT